MSKPSLFQALLGRPSQTYYFPPAKEYHSAKHDLFRAASPTDRDPLPVPVPQPTSAIHSSPGSFPSDAGLALRDPSPSPSPSPSRSSLSPSSVSRPRRRAEAAHTRAGTPPSYAQDSGSNHSMTHAVPEPRRSSTRTLQTPSPSPRHEGPHSPFVPSPSTTAPSQPPPVLSQACSNSVSHSSGHTPRGVEGEVHSDVVSASTDDDLDEDVFYTPRSSFYSSPRTSRTSANMILDPKTLVSALLPSSPFSSSSSRPTLRSERRRSRTYSDSSFSSGTASSNSSDAESVSSSRATTSTRTTTPINSDAGLRRQNGRLGPGEVETITISSSKLSKGQELNGGALKSRQRPSFDTISERRSRTQTEMRRLTYTDEDWAKDVRWLSPPASVSSHRRANSLDSSSSSTRSYSRASRPQALYPPQAKSADHRRQRSHPRRSRGSRGSRGRMSALLEEDESDYTDVTPGGSSTEVSRPPSPLQETPRKSNESTPKAGSPLRTSVARSKSQISSRSTSSARKSIPIKRTGSLEKLVQANESLEDLEALEALESPDERVKAYARSQRRSYSHTRPLSRSITLTQPKSPPSDAAAYAKTLPTHSLPTPHFSSDSAPNGYTGLTMAHAGYVGKGKALGDGKIDLIKAGIARSTMATVEVVHGAAHMTPLMTSPKKKRKTLSVSFKFLSRGSSRLKETSTPGHLLQDLPLPVAFTAHLPPPSSVPPSHVLIQVFAVGLDPLDSALVHDKVGVDRSKSTGNGFIPGRSVVGRVIECGWEVKADVCRKGEWVVGLLEVKKCGALAEFAVIERHRLHRAPQPRSRPTTLFPSAVNRRSHVRSMSLPSHLHALPSINNVPIGTYTQLSVEELALLPLNALPAHRAVRTLADAIVATRANVSTAAASEADPTATSALVLCGHDGPGSMAVQMLAKRGVSICAHVPSTLLRPDETEDADVVLVAHHISDNRRSQSMSLVEARLRSWGAEDVYFGDPLEVMEELASGGRCFDAVIDTVGGAAIWAAAQKLLLAVPAPDNLRTLSSHTQFTTLVGDNPAKPIPTAQDNLRAGFRSFRRVLNVTMPAVEASSADAKPQEYLNKGSSTSLPLTRKQSKHRSLPKPRTMSIKRTVGYAWVSVAADVDYEGEDIRDALGSVVGMVEEGWIRPWIGDDGPPEDRRVVPFDRAPEVFRRDDSGPVGLLQDGGTCVIKVVA